MSNSSSPLADLARAKALESGRPVEEWRKTLEVGFQSLRFLHLDDDVLLKIARNCENTSIFSTLARMLYQLGKTSPQGREGVHLVLEYSDASPFSLGEWLEAIHYFYGWLGQNNRKIDFLKMLGYLKCCACSPEGLHHRLSFSEVVKGMLDHCGYDG